MAHELNSGAKCDAKHGEFFDYQISKMMKRCFFHRLRNSFLIFKFVATKTLSIHIKMFFQSTIDQMFNYLRDSFIISDQLTSIISVVQREERLTFLASVILIISNIEKKQSPCKIVRLLVTQRKVLRMIGEWIYQVRSSYFYLAFERLFSDFPLSRSLRHKTRTFHAYVEKRRRTRWHTSGTQVRNAVRSSGILSSDRKFFIYFRVRRTHSDIRRYENSISVCKYALSKDY